MNNDWIDIREFGAVSNSNKVQTNELQNAINEANKTSGTVYIPSGEFVSGTLNLGNASLYLEKGAILKGSGKIDDYVPNGYYHNELGEAKCLIFSMNNSNIQIYGEGTINLNGRAFFDFNAPDTCGLNMTPEQIGECTVKYESRPNIPIFFKSCKKLKIQGITVLDAPCWTMTFVECENIKVLGLNIDTDLNIPNNDGIHFCSCKKVIVSDCNISSGDDCIALSAITDWDIECTDIVISDCVLRSCSKAIAIGYMHSVVRNITINNVIIKESNRAITIMSSYKTGLVENVNINNVILDTKIRAGNWWGNGEPLCIMGTFHHYSAYKDPKPEDRFDINIKNISVTNAMCSGENAIGIVGEDKNIENIRFINTSFKWKDSKNYNLKGKNIDLSPSLKRETLPQDDKKYWIHVAETKNVLFKDYFIEDFEGEKLFFSEKNNVNLKK